MWELVSSTSPWSWFLLLLIITLTYSYLSRLPWKHLPPGPPSFPVIGSLPFLMGDLRDVLAKMAAKYGDVFTFYMGPERVVVLNGYDVIKEALLQKSKAFDGRSILFKVLNGYHGIASNQGPVWCENKTFLQQKLRDMGVGKKAMETFIQHEVSYLVDELRTLAGTAFDIEPLIYRPIANIIMTIATGKPYKYDDPSFKNFLEIIKDVAATIGPGNPAMLFPLLRYIPGDPFGFHKAVSLTNNIRETFFGVIKQHKTLLDKGEISPGLITEYLQEMKKRATNGTTTLSERELVELITTDLTAAGTHTTTNTLVWIILYMVLNPDMQIKVQHEIDDVIGQSRVPSMADSTQMPYTMAVISEVERISSVIPQAVPHATMEEVQFRGYTIPKGTMVIANIHSVHWDPILWPNPERFIPERFLENGSYRKREELIPFSIGRRSCVGEGLAKMKLFLFFVHLLQRFTFSVPSDQPQPSTYGVLGLTSHPKPYDVMVNTR